MYMIVGSLVFVVHIAANELLFQPKSYMYGDNMTHTAYSCVFGSSFRSIATSQTDCCLTCLTNSRMNCLAGNYYPADGWCDIFEVWSETGATISQPCFSFKIIDICPPGAKYLSLFKSCVILLRSGNQIFHTWKAGSTGCRNLGPNFRMAVLDTLKKCASVLTFVKSQESSCSASSDQCVSWTGGSRFNRSSAYGDFYWILPDSSIKLDPAILQPPSSSTGSCLVLTSKPNSNFICCF
ncbi:hypothetical protein HELRODRAFT_183934 [Helobdella robusta]|uniref:Apple domain-containing protein n=1 Tax=Helobdella robusta TaxID=6412 RepID=T1FKB4_HELRO|nr:hypothetical protein HELRODRAFT_183934 [Helobdella robusta]ESO09716.1 hypothetical protein HELRODRAFT_183934 [Helobdella robusta]